MSADTDELIEALALELERAEATIACLVALLQRAGFYDDLEDTALNSSGASSG